MHFFLHKSCNTIFLAVVEELQRHNVLELKCLEHVHLMRYLKEDKYKERVHCLVHDSAKKDTLETYKERDGEEDKQKY